MSDRIFEIKVFVPNEKSLDVINYIQSPRFPMFFQPTTDDHFQYCHTFMARHDEFLPKEGRVNSEYFPFAKMVFDDFCGQHGIEYKTILRMAFNCTFHSVDLPDVHTDHEFPHKVLLMYLNDCGGETLVYNEAGDIKHRVKPEKYKCVYFSGEPHNNLSPEKDVRRMVFVATFI